MSYAVALHTTGEPQVLTRIPTTRPVPGPLDVLIRNRVAAVNHIDTIIRRGAMAAGSMPPLPHVLGVEGSGVVEAVGAEVPDYAPGDRVAWMGRIGSGGYGTYSLVSPDSIARLSEGMALDSAAALPVNAVTAWQLLVRMARAEPGETVLIRAAAGGVGAMLIQLAKHLGAKVIAVCSSTKTPFARAQGADHVLSSTDGNIAETVLGLTGGRGVDIACNPVSGDTVLEDLGLLAPFGRLVIFGFLAGEPNGVFSPDLVRHFGRSVSVQMSDVYTLLGSTPATFKSALQEMVSLHERGVLRPGIHARFDLVDAWKAHEMLEQGRAMGKLVLDIGD